MPKPKIRCNVCRYFVHVPKANAAGQMNKLNAEKIPACCFHLEYFMTEKANTECTLYWEFGKNEPEEEK